MADWTILKLIEWTTEFFTRHNVPNPRLDTELLLGNVLGLKRIDLYLKFEMPVGAAELARFKEFVQRRSKREPLQYILGSVDFCGAKILVTPAVLIPRPETEQLVTQAAAFAKEHRPDGANVLDLCTGSGAIIAALTSFLPSATFTGVDISEDALKIAHENTKMLGDKVKLCAGDLFEHLEAKGQFDLIVSNPPYVPRSQIDTLQDEIKSFEPHLALDGGEDGLDIVKKICKASPNYLSKGGGIFIEIGEDQAQKTAALFEDTKEFTKIDIINDLCGVQRMVCALGRI